MAHKPFRDLVGKLPPARQQKIHEEARRIVAAMELAELREALHMRQQDLAKKLSVSQAAISQIETRQEDIQLSTVERYVQALGGSLEIRAILPDRIVELNHLASAPRPAAQRKQARRHSKPSKMATK